MAVVLPHTLARCSGQFISGNGRNNSRSYIDGRHTGAQSIDADVSGDTLSDQHTHCHHCYLRVLTKRDRVEWCIWSFQGSTCQQHCPFCLSTDVIVRANVVIWYEWGSGLTTFFSLFSSTFSSRATRERPCVSLLVFVTK